jgi:hypothetical protein
MPWLLCFISTVCSHNLVMCRSHNLVISLSDHHTAKSPSDRLVHIWATLRSTVLFRRTMEGSKVAKGVLSLRKQEALAKSIIFPVGTMICKQNGTVLSSTLERAKEGASNKNRISLVPQAIYIYIYIPFVSNVWVGGSCDQVCDHCVLDCHLIGPFWQSPNRTFHL